MKPLVAIRNVRCIVRCCIKPSEIDDIDGSIPPSPNESPFSSQVNIEECMNEGDGKRKEEEEEQSSREGTD